MLREVNFHVFIQVVPLRLPSSAGRSGFLDSCCDLYLCFWGAWPDCAQVLQPERLTRDWKWLRIMYLFILSCHCQSLLEFLTQKLTRSKFTGLYCLCHSFCCAHRKTSLHSNLHPCCRSLIFSVTCSYEKTAHEGTPWNDLRECFGNRSLVPSF